MANYYFEVGFKTPQDVLKATDDQLLAIPGVGRNLLKRLRSFDS
tara:strand:+ start:463 stop:594 length:132 start_codon:yes stop_codon:yes gene_type:complete